MQGYDGGRLIGASNHGTNLLRRLAQRIVGEMRVSLRRARLRVAKQAADDWKAQPPSCPDAREAVPQIVEARVVAEPGALAHEVPDVPKRGEMLPRLVTGKYPRG